MKGIYLNITKTKYNKTLVNLVLNGKTDIGVTTLTSVFKAVLKVYSRKISQHKEYKNEVKSKSIPVDDMILCLKDLTPTDNPWTSKKHKYSFLTNIVKYVFVTRNSNPSISPAS